MISDNGSNPPTPPPISTDPQYYLGYDDASKSVMRITVPIDKIASEKDVMQADVFLCGFFEVVREQARFVIAQKRAQKRAGGLIRPGSGGAIPMKVLQ